jgi:hypothetical protein
MSEEIPLGNPLVRDELAKAGEELQRLEIQAAAVMGALFGFFMAAIYYGGLAWWVGAGCGAVTIVGAWGAKVAAKERTIRRSRARLTGTPAAPVAEAPLYKK